MTKLHDRVRTPTILQMEAVECGAAALGIILSYYGRIVPLAELRQVCGVSRDGVKASKIISGAKHYGMLAKAFKKSSSALQELRPPFIVYWNFNQFVIVEGFSKEQVYLNDPATGPRMVTFLDFDRAYTGIVLAISPGSEFRKGGRKPSLLLALQERLQGSTREIIVCLLAGFLLVFPGLAIPVFDQIFIDSILVENYTSWLGPLILALTIALLLQVFLTILQLNYLRKLRLKLTATLSSSFIWYLLRLPAEFYAQRFAGEIASRIGTNIKVATVLSGQLATTIIDSIMVVFYALVMFAYDWVLTLVGIFFAGINGLTLQWISRKRTDIYARSIQDQGMAIGVAISGIQSIETIKASASESDFFARWAGYYAKSIDAQQDLGITNQVLNVLPPLLTSLTKMTILIVGGLRVMQGEITIGMLVAFQSLMLNFQKPINTLVAFGSTIQELQGDLKRLDDVLQNPIDPNYLKANSQDLISEKALPGAGTQLANMSHIPARLQGYLEIRDLTFGYSALDAPLIENFNLSLTPGQRVALIGGSGSGKSTIAKLVVGLYKPWSGQIIFDDISRDSLPQSLIVTYVTMVEQEIILFEGTVRDNLTLWDTTIPQEQVVQACRDALIHDVIIALPGGYNGYLQEAASNLSGGQRQRLEIARALINNPTILVMDEATSALDTETEKIIDRNIRRRGCTCLIVAHRLSTIRDCDEIIVMDKGKIVQRGTHEEMRQVDGLYAQLLQSGGAE